jgi:hypothetical protein
LKYSENLKYFVDRHVTVLTRPVNFNLEEPILHEFFSGFVKEIDEFHVWLTTNGCVNVISIDHAIVIAENQFTPEPIIPVTSSLNIQSDQIKS